MKKIEIATLGIAHSITHIFISTLPPLLLLIKTELGISYSELGALAAVFSTVNGLMQTPSGYLADRFGQKILTIGGLALYALAIFFVRFGNFFLSTTCLAACCGSWK